VWPDGTQLHGDGHYHETYELDGGGWRIKSSTLTRLHMDLTGPASSPAEQPNGSSSSDVP
jgi:hypothetical protein